MYGSVSAFYYGSSRDSYFKGLNLAEMGLVAEHENVEELLNGRVSGHHILFFECCPNGS